VPTSAEEASALAPAGLGLTLFVVATQIRMDDPWADGVLLLVAAVPAVVLLALGLTSAQGDQSSRTSAEILLVSGLVLTGIAVARLGQSLAGEDYTAGGGTLTWMLALFTAIAAVCAARAHSLACRLIAALASVALLLEAVSWIFDTTAPDVFRALLLFAFAVLFLAGLAVEGRAGTVLVAAAGVTVIVSYYVLGLFVAFGDPSEDLGWGWQLVTLLQGAALLAFAVQRLEPGPAYLAFFVLVFFVFSVAAGTGGGFVVIGDEERPDATLLGWPLALAIGTALLAVMGLRRLPRA
jgi:hypothetical protein